MSEKPIPFSKRLQWRLECFAHSVIELIARPMPGPWVFHFGEALAGVAWHFMLKRRRIVLRNLRIAYCDQMDLDEIKKLAKKSFVRAGANLLSSVHTAGLPAEKLSEVLQIENLELLQKFADEGKGVVLLLSHMGNWELLSRLIHFIPEGVALGGMYRPLNNPYMDERVRIRRQVDGSRMFSKRDSFHQITGFLRDGGIVGILADQRVGKNGDRIRFFGRVTMGSPLPSLLARRAKAEVVALSLTTVEPGKWRAKLSHMNEKLSTENCMEALEAAMKLHPTDVFWLQDRWKVMVQGERWHPQKIEDKHVSGDKWLRVLVWWMGGDEPRCPTGEWSGPDIRYEFAITDSQPRPSWLSVDAHCHAIHPFAGIGRLKAMITAIDEAEVLPLDLILVSGGLNEMRMLARSCGIRCALLE